MTSTAVTSHTARNLRDARIRQYGSQLAQPGKLEDAKSDADWLARVNGRLVFEQNRFSRVSVPKTLSAAVAPDGKLHKNAEVYVFGNWLLLDGAPGLTVTRGVQPDRRKVVETLCCALGVAECSRNKHDANGQRAVIEPKTPTKRNLVAPMRQLFDQALASSDFDSRLKTLRRILDDSLRHLSAGDLCVAGNRVTTSPRLKALQGKFKPRGKVTRAASPTASAPGVLSASGPAASAAVTPSVHSAPAPGVKSAKFLPPVVIPLSYAHQNRQIEFRTAPFAGLPQSKLDYTWHEPEAHPGSKSLRSDRRDMVVLKPALDIVAQSNLKAVIDRLAIRLCVTRATNVPYLHKLLNDFGLIGIAHDRRLNPKGDASDFKYHLGELDPSIGSGTHFAIQIQEPRPEKIAKFLRAVDTSCKIDGSVVPFLLELAIDVLPKSTKSPEEMVTLREQLVGTIQRHFWCIPEILQDETGKFNAQQDPRQVYDEAAKDKPKTSFLITSKNKRARRSVFTWKKDPDVRKRILAEPQKELWLNATSYFGSRECGLRFSAQHKISDQRDKSAGTYRSLKNDERRARVELEIHGAGNLHALGIEKIDDFARTRFREIFLKHGSFKLAAMKTQGISLQEFVTMFGFRGVIGASLFSAAKEFVHREKLKAEGKGFVRASETQAPGLEAWIEMNQATGRALDGLSHEWRKFAWP